ncbi:MAG: hypothetical protein COA41_17645 [Sphingopyxis sp.]|nr:MAG: hypothetical protein COA41_17645 [Sphingopyxis sp.]
MTYQDEFARRNARAAAAGEGGDPDKPLLFRSFRSNSPPDCSETAGGRFTWNWDGGGGDADASLASANGDRPHPNPSPEGEGLQDAVHGEEQTRHPELVSGPRADKPEDGGKRDGIESGEHAPDTPDRLERSRETGDGAEVSRPWPVLSDCPSRQSKGSTRTDRETQPPSCSALDAEPCAQNTNAPADAQSSASSAEHSPSSSRAPRHDGWLPETRVKFLEALARTGNVGASAYYVQLSRQSAYDLRRRDPDFARAWRAALVLARDVAEDALQERAIEGIEEPVFYHGECVATRRRYDSRLLLAHLARLDRVAEEIPAQRGAARFGDMLDAIAKGEDTAPLIATPTDEELAAAAAHAEALQPLEEDEGDEFYAVIFPDQDGPPDYYRMTPEEAAEMERDVPGLTAIPTGTRNDRVVSALHFEELARAELAEKAAEDDPWLEEADDAGGEFGN